MTPFVFLLKNLKLCMRFYEFMYTTTAFWGPKNANYTENR